MPDNIISAAKDEGLHEQVANLLRIAAEREVMPRFQNLRDDEISCKSSPQDLVTAADIRAEKWLKPQLLGLKPGSVLIGEESVAEDPALLYQLDDKGVFWIVDPVDGTGNFVKGSERFAMMVALVERGETTHSWIYAPTLDAVAVAQKGAGAFWQGTRLCERQKIPFAASKAEYSESYMPKNLRKTLRQNMRAMANHHNGRSSAWAYLDCARGDVEMVLAGRMKPWDHAAGVLLVEESGGRAGMILDGAAYKPLPYVEPPMLTVANAAMWEPYRRALVVDDVREG